MKLVRDNIPYLIAKNGDTPLYHVANDKEFEEMLYTKLKEEVSELIESKGSILEIADILEVMDTIIKLNGWVAEEVEIAKALKRKTNGSFTKRYILDGIKKESK